MNGYKLELTWIGKEKKPKLEPRVMIEDFEKSYYAEQRVSEKDIYDNMLIFGDNLLALKALETEYIEEVKCIYIDPPYNTGSAFELYDDGIEHSIWLSLMRDRLLLLHKLLRPDGVIFISIDDNEYAYLSVLMDEIFERKNYCGTLIWEKKKKPSFLSSNMGIITEYILCYAKDRSKAPAFIYGTTTESKKYPLNNAGNGIKIIKFPPHSVKIMLEDTTIEPQDMSEGKIITRLLDPVTIYDSYNVNSFRLEGEWRYSQEKLDQIITEGDELIISKIPFRPNHIKKGGEPKKLKNLLSSSHYNMATYEDATAESRALFGHDNSFPYPKPEMLIQLLINSVTKEGDIVLDSFAGSGTTGAVAHKMGRKWIMVELGEHCHTHIIPRMKKVIDGTDQGGISKDVNWKGGGGFRYYRLAPSLLEKDKWGNWVISKDYNKELLAEAICKLEGFIYAPSETIFWQQGYSTESDYIYVTTQILNEEQIRLISEEVGENRTLLILCLAFTADVSKFNNLTVKKIPKQILNKCEYGKDDYSMNIKNLPLMEQPEKQSNIFEEGEI